MRLDGPQEPGPRPRASLGSGPTAPPAPVPPAAALARPGPCAAAAHALRRHQHVHGAASGQVHQGPARLPVCGLPLPFRKKTLQEIIIPHHQATRSPSKPACPSAAPGTGLESRSPKSGLLPSSRKLRPDSCLCRSLPLEDQISLLKGATIEICHIALNTTFCLQSQHFLCGPLRYAIEDGADGDMVLDSRGVCPCGVAGGKVTRGSSACLFHSGVSERVLRAALSLPRSRETTAAPGARVCALGRHGSLLSR